MRGTLVVVFLAVMRLAAQDSSPAEVRHILLDVVEKKHHMQVDNLNTGNFRVRLNGQLVRVVSAERVAIKPRVAVLMDTSGSMGAGKWSSAVNLVKTSVETLQPIADVSFAEFSDRTQPLTFVSDSQQMSNILKEIEARPKEARGRGKTAIRDSIIVAIKDRGLRSGDAVLLITDGGENISRESEQKMERQIFQSGVRVFVILLGGAITPEERAGASQTAQLTERTGGAIVTFGYWPFISPSPPAEPKAMKQIPQFGRYIARRIVLPYILEIEAGASANGKLQVEAIEASSQRMKNIVISAPYRLEAATAGGQGSGN